MMMMAFAVAFLTADADNKKKATQVQTVVFNVSMHCGNCQKKIEGTIGWEKGVKNLKTDLAQKTVTISYDASKTSSEKLQKSIEKLGYKVETVKK